MNLNFILSNLDIIFLAVWVIFFVLVAIRFARPAWLKNIHYGWLVFGAVALHLLYVGVVTWGQYHVWAVGGEITNAILSAPLPIEAPLPGIFEWTREYFDQPLGYFAYYALGRFFLNILILFIVAGLFYVFFKLMDKYRGGFNEYGPELLLILMLISGWPGILVLVPLGLILATLSLLYKGRALDNPLMETRIEIEQAFLVATPLALLFAHPILAYLNLLALLTV